jgi:hypothetical protein
MTGDKVMHINKLVSTLGLVMEKNKTKSISSATTTKQAFDWGAIPQSLRDININGEGPSKSTPLDDVLRSACKLVHPRIACRTLSGNIMVGCGRAGELEKKGYGGREGHMKYQVRCKSCKRTYTWATRVSPDRPSLAEVVWDLLPEDVRTKLVGKRQGQGGRQVEQPIVDREDETAEIEMDLEGDMVEAASCASWAEMTGPELDARGAGVEPATQEGLIEILNKDDNPRGIHETEGLGVIEVPSVIMIPEVVVIPERVQRLGVPAELVVGTDGRIEVGVVRGLIECLSRVLEKVEELESRMRDREAEGVSGVMIVDRSYAAVARATAAEQRTTAVEKRTTRLMESGIDKEEAEVKAEAWIALEGRRRREPEKLQMVYISGLRCQGYGAVRRLLSQAGVPQMKMLSMVWRGDVLEVVIPVRMLGRIRESFKGAKVKVDESINWPVVFDRARKVRGLGTVVGDVKRGNEDAMKFCKQALRGIVMESCKRALWEVKHWVEEARKTDSEGFQRVQRRRREDRSKVMVAENQRSNAEADSGAGSSRDVTVGAFETMREDGEMVNEERIPEIQSVRQVMVRNEEGRTDDRQERVTIKEVEEDLTSEETGVKPKRRRMEGLSGGMNDEDDTNRLNQPGSLVETAGGLSAESIAMKRTTTPPCRQ